MNIQRQNLNSLFMGNNSIFNNGLKSTQEKLQRQAERDKQVDFFEKQKENLKNMNCDSLEEISRKLELFHSYEDQIAAAKEAYNDSQMLHVMDEAEERGEQIAKAAEKNAPKTAEERKEEMVEEALGTEEKSELTESMEEFTRLIEDVLEEEEEILEENLENTEAAEALAEAEAESEAETETDIMQKQLEDQTDKYKRFNTWV